MALLVRLKCCVSHATLLVCCLLTSRRHFALNGSACWGKVLNVSCHLACLMSAYQMGAFELNDSTCLGKGLNVACCPACLVCACPLERETNMKKGAEQTRPQHIDKRTTNNKNNIKTLGEENIIHTETGKLNRSRTKSTHRETLAPESMNKRAAKRNTNTRIQ